jgi:peptide methionine sulfoxide reductase MsrA
MTTPTAILLTQIPIALGCFWLAWELRKLRKSIDSTESASPPPRDPSKGAPS